MDESIAPMPMSLVDGDISRRYRCGAIVRFTVGNGLELVYCRNSRSLELLPAEVAALLGRCGSLKTLDEHALKCCGGTEAAAEQLSATKSRLKELADSGFLVCEHDFFDQLARPAVQTLPSVAIASVCVPTCDRLNTLEPCLESYIANCKKYGKDNDFVVMDDSRDPQARNDCRQMLRTVKAEQHADIKYAGYEEKSAFLQRLIDETDLPPDVLRFALFGKEEFELATYGANQNAILLHSIGDTLFSADDDTLCRVAVAPTKADGLGVVSGVYTSRHELLETWLFPDRETARASVSFVDSDLLDMHEQYLGLDLLSCMSAGAQNGPLDLDRSDFRFGRMLASGEGRVLVTLNGLAGDCAYTHPDYCLFFTGRSLERLTQSDAEFRVNCVSPACLRVVNRVTITDKMSDLHSGFLGLDNRQLLPPFSPVARGQDILFGQLLSQCFYNAYYCRLPWALLHEPMERRSFSNEQIVETRPGIGGVNRLIALLAGSLSLGDWKADPVSRLRYLGRYLEELGRMPAAEFEELGRLLHWRSVSLEIAQLERAIEKAGRSRQFFAEVVRERATNKSARLAETQEWLPHDLKEGRNSSETLKLAQELVWRFGQLLRWWPDIVESARMLRAQGYALAKPV